MEFSLEHRTARLSVGELADFQIGPRASGDGPQGIWRAQLGTRWHQELRSQVSAENAHAIFEVALNAEIMHRGWRISLNGRIDQLIPPASPTRPRENPAAVLREIKTVLRPIPAAEEELRAEHPSYFAQLAAYLALARLAAPIHPALRPETPVHGELMFVEAGSGLAQTIVCTAADEQGFHVQLESLAEFLDLRLRARERLRRLNFRPAFATPRPGQEDIHTRLRATLQERPVVFFEAPTGFGKTGVMLETALTLMKDGVAERVLYLTSKATGQLQVSRQLARMTGGDTATSPALLGQGLAVWHVRNKREHCVNSTYQCVRDACRFLHDVPTRWKQHGLSRFYLRENEDRSIEALREAGANAGLCPYEITRTALAFNDVWIGDYNYVFSPNTRGLFFDQPGFDPANTLLVIDEAHNLPSRVADAYSHSFLSSDAAAVTEALHHTRAYAPLVAAWEHWAHFLHGVKPTEALELADEDDARHLLDAVARQVGSVPLDFVALGPAVTECLWGAASLGAELSVDLPRLWWCPRAGELMITCLDAAKAIGPTLRSFRRSLLASATLGPPDAFAASCGLDVAVETPTTSEGPERLGKLNKRQTKKLFAQLSTGRDLLAVEEQRSTDEPALVRAPTPWRDNAYNVAVDLRVDTSYQQRSRYHSVTAATIARLCEAALVERQLNTDTAATACVAVFFPSYSYADLIKNELERARPDLRVALQPRLPDLAAQNAWMEESLVLADTLFLILGSSFAEGVDLLGGRVNWAMVVGPALPEVNAVQKARVAAHAELRREEAFRRVYQIPGIQKVNQGLGRLVRAPGQHAHVLLHCRRFIEPAYATLLAPEYQKGAHIADDESFTAWLQTCRPPETA
jgi:DNA excision repair protein ERCC-2